MTAPENRPKVGLMVRDPVRAEGLAAIFCDVAELYAITPVEAVHDGHLAVVMVDADEAIMGLLAAFRRARPGLRLMVFGHGMEPGYIGRIVAAGAKAYLAHSASAEEIRAAFSVVSEGSIWAPRKVLAGLIETYSPEEPQRHSMTFSARERQILELLVHGQPDREIAQALQLSVRTVQSAVSRMLRKAGVSNRVALTVRALEKQMLMPPHVPMSKPVR